MGRTGSECSLFFYLVVFMGCSQNWGKGSFTEKDKGFRRRELCCSGWQRQDESERPESIGQREREDPGSQNSLGGNRRGTERPGSLWRREFGKDKCPTGDTYIFLILLRVVLCKFSPFRNCQLIHIAH